MAIILVMDKVPRPGRKLPTIQKIVCDGFLLYSENSERGEAKLNGRGQVHPAEIARAMIDNRRPGNVGEPLYHELREELARLGAEAQAEHQRQRRK